jgi:hypothetical protein
VSREPSSIGYSGSSGMVSVEYSLNAACYLRSVVVP